MEEAEVERMAQNQKVLAVEWRTQLLEAWAVGAEVELEERLVEAEVNPFSQFLKLVTVLDLCITRHISSSFTMELKLFT